MQFQIVEYRFVYCLFILFFFAAENAFYSNTKLKKVLILRSVSRRTKNDNYDVSIGTCMCAIVWRRANADESDRDGFVLVLLRIRKRTPLIQPQRRRASATCM